MRITPSAPWSQSEVGLCIESVDCQPVSLGCDNASGVDHFEDEDEKSSYGYIYRDRNRDLVCSSYDSADNWIHPRPVADSFSDSGTILSSTLQLPKPIKHILKLSASYEKAVLRIPFVRSECPELTVVGNHLKT